MKRRTAERYGRFGVCIEIKYRKGTSATEEEGDIPEMQIQIHDIIVADETEKEEMKGEDKTEQVR